MAGNDFRKLPLCRSCAEFYKERVGYTDKLLRIEVSLLLNTRKKQVVVVTVAVALWMSLVGFGMSILWRYSTTPGQPAAAPAEWPAGAPVRRENARSTMVMFAHPHCPCSSASIGELAIIMARSQEKLDAHVFFYASPKEASSWVRTNLWNNAKSIPGVHVIEDPAGSFAQHFGASTSGQALLYNPVGRLVFKGGITASRGHSGDNHGRDAILALLQGENLAQSAAPVFGCSLRGE